MRALLAITLLAACSQPVASEPAITESTIAEPTVPASPASEIAVAEAAIPAAPRVIELTGAMAQGGFGRGKARGGEVAEVLLDGKAIPVAEDGRFFVAFGRDADLTTRLDVRYADGLSIGQDFELADTSFPESRLPAATTKRIEASAGFRKRRAEQVKRITASRSGRSDLTGWAETFVKPAEGRTSGVFGSQRFYGDEPRSPHSGMDIAAPKGAPVTAPASGKVALAGGGYSFEGKLVIVDHGLGLYSAFLHLSRIDVEVGDMLAKGDAIGRVGSSGRATGPHLHWGLWWDGVRFDPEAILGR
ncbi:MAG: M23 family metallopeptidase [Pacificimonas sp.]